MWRRVVVTGVGLVSPSPTASARVDVFAPHKLLVDFLASPCPDSITGAEYVIDGDAVPTDSSPF